MSSLIRQEQARQSFLGTPLSMLITLVNACLLYYLLEPVTPENYALTWLAVITVVSLARLALYIAFCLTKPGLETIKSWSLFFTLGSLAAGCTWGAVSIYLFPIDSISHQVFIAFIIAGMTAAAVTTLSINWIDTLAFILPAYLS